MIWHWLLHFTGANDETGTVYGFWSGFGSDLSEITLVGLVIGGWRKHNCHTKRCWRIGRHVVSGTPYCNHHHEAARRPSEGHPEA
jgi:hypothetical protein